jgi:predicted Zn-dependent protease
MKQLSIFILAALLTGCAATPSVVVQPAPQLFADAQFSKPARLLTADDIFALTPAMKEYVANIRANLHGRNAHEALFEALYRRDQLRLDYDSEMTRTAAQAFEARSGNCLSLVIMTSALAHEMDLNVQYQKIAVEDTWSRTGNLYFNNGHVNIVLSKPVSAAPAQYDRAFYLTVDFQPPADMELLESTTVPESTIVAMFMNNRSAEALVANQLDEAYWYARAAIERDPGFLFSYNTMSIVYQRHGNLAEAERILRFAHERDPNNTVTLSNLAQILTDMGRTAEALAIRHELEKAEPNPPFYYFNLGQKAMQEHDYRRARALFAREVQRAPYYHEFHFWLAKAAYELGDVSTADKHMALAMSNSTTRGDHDLYAAKLDRLRMYENKGRLRPEIRTN